MSKCSKSILRIYVPIRSALGRIAGRNEQMLEEHIANLLPDSTYQGRIAGSE
jgi:hypothetical protein